MGGKFSFPIIHCILSRPNDTQLLNILKQRTENMAIKKHAVELMVKCGSFEHTRRELANIKDDVMKEIETLGGHPKLAALIEYLDKQVSDQPAVDSAASSTTAPSSATSLVTPTAAAGKSEALTTTTD